MWSIVPATIVYAKDKTMSAEATLARWQEDEKAVRSRLAATTGWARPGEVAGRSGMEIFQAIFAGELPPPPIGDTLDFLPVHIEPGVAVFSGRPLTPPYKP